MMSTMEDAFYTIDETAKLLKVARVTVDRLIRRGEIRPIKVGRVNRIPREEILAFIERHKQS